MAKGMISTMSWVTLPFTGNETVEVVQGGVNKRMLLKDLITEGADGKSAFDLAREAGYSGDVTGWLASLVGPQGPKGDEGPRGPKGDRGTDGTNGTDGVDGTDGESAFEIYKRVKGWDGTELEWIEQVLENNGGGTGGGTGQDGADGESAYEIYKRVTGFTGTEEEYLQEIKGEKGDEGPQGPKGDPGNDGRDGTDGINGVDGEDGESAYELAVRLGQYSGTEQEFADLLASIESVGSGGGTGGGSGGGDLDAGLFPIGVMKIKVNDFPAGVWETPDGVTIEKVYSDSSIRVTHPFGRNPVWFSMLNVLGEPPTMYVPTSLRNMQVIDTNTFIITNANASPTYELNVIF